MTLLFRSIVAAIASGMLLSLSARAPSFAQLATSPTPAPSQASIAEVEFWQSVKNSKIAAEVKAYLDKYPDGEFAVLAKLRLQALQPAPATGAPAPYPWGASPSTWPRSPAEILAPGFNVQGTMRPPIMTQHGHPPDTVVEMTPVITREVQQKLYDLGHNITIFDGRHSHELTAAINRLQQVSNLPVTGKLTERQLAAMRLTPAPTVWAAIGVTPTGQWISRARMISRAAAESSVKSACAMNYNKACTVTVVSGDRCVAIAHAEHVSAKNRYHALGVGHGFLFTEAGDKALMECQGLSKNPNGCMIKEALCADGRGWQELPDGIFAVTTPTRTQATSKAPAAKAAPQPKPQGTPFNIPGFN